MKANIDEYKNILIGKIEYDIDCKNIEDFLGTIKLKKDRKFETINYQNIVLAGSKVLQTDWFKKKNDKTIFLGSWQFPFLLEDKII